MKRVLFTAALPCIAYLAIELFALALYPLLYGKMFSFAEMEEHRAKVVEQSRQDNKYFADFANTPYLTLHPFLGFVYNVPFFKDDPLMTNQGFRGEVDPLVASRDPNIAIVAITGGSVAERMFVHARPMLHRKLDALPQFQGRRVAIIMLGREIYSQPQQLLAVSYYLIQGGRLDMLINLDGFNEVHNGYINHQEGIYSAYPFAYLWRDIFATSQMPDSQKLGAAMMWKYIRYKLVRASAYTRYSVSLSTSWKLIDLSLYRHMVKAENTMMESTQQREPYFLNGPNIQRDMTPEEASADVALMWERGSVQLQQLARANSFKYYHFIQPNQYWNRSKPLNAEEKSIAYDLFSKEARAVLMGYPKLMARVPSLRKHGVDIHDLTDIFRNTAETIYEDSCCHVNQRGNDMLAEALGDYIAAHPQH